VLLDEMLQFETAFLAVESPPSSFAYCSLHADEQKCRLSETTDANVISTDQCRVEPPRLI
jgi:hypothetical protein